MAIFKENLTSKILQEESLKILNSFSKNIKVLEIGCGNGNITLFLEKNANKHFFYLSDVSLEAINVLKKNLSRKKIIAKNGKFFEPWFDERPFDLIISDISSINQSIADKSPWYNGVVSNCGEDGLNNIKILLKDLPNYLSKTGVFILPVISLCNLEKLDTCLKNSFKTVTYTKKIYWPMPEFYKENLDFFNLKVNKENITLDYKFGSFYAYTFSAICSNI
jgi:methylase of polypeptide subunit release factors